MFIIYQRFITRFSCFISEVFFWYFIGQTDTDDEKCLCTAVSSDFDEKQNGQNRQRWLSISVETQAILLRTKVLLGRRPP